MSDSRIRCDYCDELIGRYLVEDDDRLTVKLACGCHVLERTRGRAVPFINDPPDKWYEAEVVA